MNVRALHSKQLFAAVGFVAATMVLAVQFINPSPVVVSVGENGAEVAELGGYFRYQDAAIIAVSALLAGASGTYLLVNDARATLNPPEESSGSDSGDGLEPSDELLEARRQEWSETADRLANNEREIYEIVLEADGVLAQSEIVERTDISKATVSRSLDSLETKDLLERKRRGMGNMVLLT